MAYISKENKAMLAANVKPLIKKFGLKGSLSVRNRSTLILKLKFAKSLLLSPELERRVDDYGLEIARNHGVLANTVKPKYREIIEALVSAMKGENFFDDSDAMIDYFNVSHYVQINVVS